MKLKVNNKKTPVEIKSMKFKEKGVIIFHEDGENDIYTYDWLFRHECEIEK